MIMSHEPRVIEVGFELLHQTFVLVVICARKGCGVSHIRMSCENGDINERNKQDLSQTLHPRQNFVWG